jgi:hypothetical protein
MNKIGLGVRTLILAGCVVASLQQLVIFALRDKSSSRSPGGLWARQGR